MVTTTVRMLYRVHTHTTHLRPSVTLGLKLMVGATSLQHGLIYTPSASYQTNHSAVG